MRSVRCSFITLAFVAAAVAVPLDGPLADSPERPSAPGREDTGAPIERVSEQALDNQASEHALEPSDAQGACATIVTTSAPAAKTPRAVPVPLARTAPPSTKPPESPPTVAPAPPRQTRITLPLEVEVHGRLYVGVAADGRDDWTRRLDMDSARIGIEARLPGVRTVLEADVASSTPIKDAYARLDGPLATRLQAGRFKAPFSARQLESSWKLPLVDRGLVNDYLVKDNNLGGRRLGATAGLRPWDGRLEIVGGLFAGERSAFGGENRAQDLAARVSGSPWRPLELGATAYRAGSNDPLVPVLNAASVYAVLSGGPLEASVEGFAGKITAGDFTAGTALVGWTVAIAESRRLRVTPVAGGEVLRLRGTTRGVGYSAIAGAVLSWTEGLKVKLQGERARRPGDDVPANALAVQFATRF